MFGAAGPKHEGSSHRELVPRGHAEMVPAFPPVLPRCACQPSCHSGCSRPLTLTATEAHKDIFPEARQKRVWFDLCPWPSAACKPSSRYRSIAWKVERQFHGQAHGFPGPLPSQLCMATRRASLALRAPRGCVSFIV